MLRHIHRFFSGNSYHEKLESLKPLINSPYPSPNITAFFALGAAPVFLGGLSTALFPHINLFTTIINDIALYTCLYSTIHTSFLAGIHLGFSSVLYDPLLGNNDSRYIKLQMIYPFFAPIMTSAFCYVYWVTPYSNINALYSISGIAFTYLGIYAGDYYYAVNRKTIPMWYKRLKLKITVSSVAGLILVLYGVFMFPELTKPKTQTFARPSSQIILDN
ncbi:hypothetical protein SteCoe_6935 [Stentor coeruleus]|uniref:Uncharacterized protein n=1 Tax=Stentor coeruleus TaxID=5963 RepID=A0A1R2CNU4_9CILI|nr:hypothetical protein SteCoe_6935 [Stentor coeruleus]